MEVSDYRNKFYSNLIKTLGLSFKKIYTILLDIVVDSGDSVDAQKLIEISLRLGFESYQEIYNCNN